MCPYFVPHTSKIHTPFTLGISDRAKPLVFSFRQRLRVGSIPIARSILRQRQVTLGYGIRVKDIDPMGKSWEIDAEEVAVSLPHVAPLYPKIHTYSHTQPFTKINCVILTHHS